MMDIEIAKRMEKLERDNRRLKRGGLVFLAIFAALTTIYATRPVPDVIKAHTFEAVDSAGMARIRLGVTPTGSAAIAMSRASGAVVAAFEVTNKSTRIEFLNTRGKPGVTLATEGSKAGIVDLLELGGVDPVKHSGISMSTLENSDSGITLWDAHGYRMDLGSTGLSSPVTGTTLQTSADSIIMFGNDKQHHIIWQAPAP